MKLAIKVVIVGVVGIAGYFIVKSLLPKDPFALDDAYRLMIDHPTALPDSMRITNNSDIDLRLHLFNAGDPVRVLARENWVLRRGQSRTYPRDPYVFHVWQSQFFDAHITWTDELWTDVVFAGSASNLRVQGLPRGPVTITNDVDEQLKHAPTARTFWSRWRRYGAGLWARETPSNGRMPHAGSSSRCSSPRCSIRWSSRKVMFKNGRRSGSARKSRGGSSGNFMNSDH